MDALKIKEYATYVSHLKKIKQYSVDVDETLYFDKLIEKYSKIVNETNLKELNVYDPSRVELGKILSCLKARVRFKHYNQLTEKLGCKNKAFFKIKEDCEKTKLSDEIISARILFIRKTNGWYKLNKLELEIDEYLKNEIHLEFLNQNPEYLTY
jgi:hypothetical protein